MLVCSFDLLLYLSTLLKILLGALARLAIGSGMHAMPVTYVLVIRGESVCRKACKADAKQADATLAVVRVVHFLGKVD